MALPYYYNSQIKKYLMQFQNIFTGLQVNVGANEERGPALISVPVQYGSRDRVTAALLASNTQNKPLRLPLISTYLTGIQMAPELRKGVGGQRSETYVPRGGVVPDDIKVVKQYMPIPYRLTAEVSIYTSNMEQHFQVIVLVNEYIETLNHMFAQAIVFNWDEESRSLRLYKTFWKEEKILVDAVIERPEQDLLNDRYAINWIQRWAASEARMMLAEIRGKYSTLPGAGGGVTLNASDLRIAAKEGFEQCEREIDDFIANKLEDVGMEGSFLIG